MYGRAVVGIEQLQTWTGKTRFQEPRPCRLLRRTSRSRPLENCRNALRFFLVGLVQRADAYTPHLLEGLGLRFDGLVPLQNGAQQVLAAGGE